MDVRDRPDTNASRLPRWLDLLLWLLAALGVLAGLFVSLSTDGLAGGLAGSAVMFSIVAVPVAVSLAIYVSVTSRRERYEALGASSCPSSGFCAR